MKNELAKLLVEAADKHIAWHSKSFANDPDMLATGKQDYEDLVSIASMIENNENSKSIMLAMWKLDTCVRDVIPDKVYYVYNE